MTTRGIAIVGAGGFGLEAAMLIEQVNSANLQWNLIGYFDDGKKIGPKVNDLNVLGGIDEINRWKNSLGIVVAIAKPDIKKKVVQSVDNKHIYYPTIIHPSVLTGRKEYVAIGEGCIICANNIITTNVTIGNHVIINLCCTIGHESYIGNYSSFMPNCNISGGVSIEECTYWGTGSIIINNLKVGRNTIIGAGSVVVRDVPSNVTVAGVPAKIIKTIDEDQNRSKAADLRNNRRDLIALLEEVLEAESGQLKESEELVNIDGWDSMALLGLIATVDDRFGITINLEKLASIKNVAEILDLLESQVDSRKK